MKFTRIKYNRLTYGLLSFVPTVGGDTIKMNRTYVRSRVTYNKVAFLPVEGTSSARSWLNVYKSYNWNVQNDSNLYVSSACKTKRDYFRNSGYKIVRDKSKADFVVIPEYSYNAIHLYDIAAFDENHKELTLYTIKDNFNKVERTPEERYNACKEYLTRTGLSVIDQESTEKPVTCTFLRDVDEFTDILTPDYPPFPYISEMEIYLTPTLEINIENLNIWKRMLNGYNTTGDMFSELLCQSNWKDYPVTMLYFLKDVPYMNVRYAMRKNAQAREILLKIGYSEDRSFMTSAQDKIVNPCDWELLQEYIYNECNLPQNGGWVTEKSRLGPELVSSRIYVKPIHISQPMVLRDIVELCEG